MPHHGKGGRPQKPIDLHLVEGTFRPDRHGKRLPENRPETAATSCPSWLDDYAKAEWRRLAPQLMRVRLLGATTRVTFAGYCQATSDLRRFIELERGVEDIEARRRLAISRRQATRQIAILSHDLKLYDLHVHSPAAKADDDTPKAKRATDRRGRPI